MGGGSLGLFHSALSLPRFLPGEFVRKARSPMSQTWSGAELSCRRWLSPQVRVQTFPVSGRWGAQRASSATCLVAGREAGTKRTEAWLSVPGTGKQVLLLQADCVAGTSSLTSLSPGFLITRRKTVIWASLCGCRDENRRHAARGALRLPQTAILPPLPPQRRSRSHGLAPKPSSCLGPFTSGPGPRPTPALPASGPSSHSAGSNGPFIL